jgi:hypothetical protein
MQASHRTTAAVSAPAEVNVSYILTPFSENYGEIVTISVGSEAVKKEFYIHAGLLLHYSSYFSRALNPVWVEGRTKSIALSEDRPAIFQIFFRWIYTGGLYSTLVDGAIPILFEDICALYIFADARGIPELCNRAVDVLLQKSVNERIFPTHCLTYVYDNTLAGSNLRSTIVDLAVSCCSFGSLENNEERFPKQFLIDVIFRSRQLKTAPGGLTDRVAFLEEKAAEMCIYHDHEYPHDPNKTQSS